MLKESLVNSSESVGRKKQESVVFERSLYQYVLLLGISWLYLPKLLQQFILCLRNFIRLHLLFLLSILMPILLILFKEIKVLPGEVPRTAVVPYIPPIIQNQMIVLLGRQYFFQRLAVQTIVLVTTYNPVLLEIITALQKWILVFPGLPLMALFSSILSPHKLAYLLCIYPRSFCIHVYFIVFAHLVQEVFQIGSHFDNNQVLSHEILRLRNYIVVL